MARGLVHNLKYIKISSTVCVLWLMSLYKCSFYSQVSWAGTTMWQCQCQHPPSLSLWDAGKKLNSPSHLLSRQTMSFLCHVHKLISGWCLDYCWKMVYMHSIFIYSVEWSRFSTGIKIELFKCEPKNLYMEIIPKALFHR